MFGNPYSQPAMQNPYEQRLNFLQNGMQQPQPQQAVQLNRVNGIEGAKAFQIPPNSAVALFDGNEDIMYIKTSDSGGFPSIKAYAFTEVVNRQESAPQYVTREEFEELKGMIMNGKQSVQQSKNAGTDAKSK